ncbi:MAG TPA: DUF305 domain-containing protein, partial [Allosphingosinicella sp.]|nr:DUF305 domain-containing protein [Allosphingosinicella sp.]
MFTQRKSSLRLMLRSCGALALAAAASGAMAQPPIVQPGAPGQAPRTLNAQEAARVADTRVTAFDVQFMQDMIWHHHQAVEMAALVGERTNRPPLVAAAGRISASQADEIRFMQSWLRERGREAPDPLGAGGHAGHGADGGAHHNMPGMATEAQMRALQASRGVEFDRLFLQRMIAHHEGALTMARQLLGQGGSGSDPALFKFASEVLSEQQAEIDRLSGVLAELTSDPRTTLAGGLTNAAVAAQNMRLVTSLPKPAGFADTTNPPSPRGFLFANTDMAFSKDLMAVGSYHGFNLYRIGANGTPQLASSVVCPGGQGDVSIVGDLLIMSVEENRGRVDCGTDGVSGDVSPERFRGLRIFNISNPARPTQVGQVQTCRGSHTHSVVSADANTVIVYNSGTSSVRSKDELARCVPGTLDPGTALFSIDIIEIPVANPAQARIVDSPRVFAEDGRIAGLWAGGRHGPGTQETSRTDQCHDITVFPSKRLAAGACSGNGIILDISDPRRPRRIDAATDPNFAYWHSATFNNDGTKVLFTDEWGGGGGARCRAKDPREWGANAFYDIVDGQLQFRSHQKLPAPQGDNENCVAHNGSIVPVPGRDIFVQAWYQGGISVIDFTDSANVREIAYFDRGPIDPKTLVLGGIWSAYWYGGRIYGTEIVRGLDVLELQPSEHLTANEIEAAKLASQGETFNPQQQYPVSWPAHPAVALAYVDQLQRSRSLNAG